MQNYLKSFSGEQIGMLLIIVITGLGCLLMGYWLVSLLLAWDIVLALFMRFMGFRAGR